jgi:hypothetical protein
MSILTKKKHHFWRGKYCCLDKNCKNIFVAKIFFEDIKQTIGLNNIENLTFSINLDTKINVNIKIVQGNYNHIDRIIKPVVCSGLKRIKQAREILLKSVSIVQNENVLNNILNLGNNGKNKIFKMEKKKKLELNYIN